MHTRRLSILLAFLAFLAAAAVPGCRSVQSASYARAALLTGEVAARPSSPTSTEDARTESTTRWPSRWGGDPDKPGVIIEMDPTQPLRPMHLSRYHQARATPADYEDAGRLAAALGLDSGFKFRAEGPGSFLFAQDTRRDQPVSDPPDMAFKFVSASEIDTRDSTVREDEDHVALQRTWFTYRDPDDPDAEPLGVIVLLPGMFGTPEPIVTAAERFWHNRGYGVLRMLSHPSRFTQHLELMMASGLEEAVAARAARVSDDRIAEVAYATDAALDHVFAARPGLAGLPTVLVGMSGGAMALPTVYSYSPRRYDAAVLIAGGANFLRIMIESNYRDWIDAILIDFDPISPTELGRPSPEQVETLSKLYLERSRLDAYHTASEMSDIPVLMLHATNDRAVPAATGESLYRRLSQPERWTYPLGHELIFAGLPMQIPRIDRWLTEQVLKAPGGSTVTERASGERQSASDSE